jgi:predicted small metal-binding protein
MGDKKLHTEVPAAGSNPNVQSSEGSINPSAPSTGSAGWGTTPDENRKQVGQNNPEASSPNATGAGDIQNEAAQNPAAQASIHPRGNRSFRCGDAVQKDCIWSVTGNSEEEILGYMRAHAREAHGKKEFTSEELADARRAIHKKAA